MSCFIYKGFYESDYALMRYVAWKYGLDIEIWGNQDWKPRRFVFGETRKDVFLAGFEF